MPRHHRGRNVQPADDVLALVEEAVTVGILVDRDLVRSPRSMGRRFGYGVETGPQVVVVFHDLETGGKLVLEVLGDPKPAPAVPTHEEGLPDPGLGCHEVDGEPFAHFEFPDRFLRRSRRGVVGQGSSPSEGPDHLGHLITAGFGRRAFFRGLLSVCHAAHGGEHEHAGTYSSSAHLFLLRFRQGPETAHIDQSADQLLIRFPHGGGAEPFF